MPDLGLGVTVSVDPPAGPTFAVSPPASPSVLVAPVQGPPGAKGDPGMGQGGYTHTQASPSAVWTVQHQLGFNPQPVVTSTGGHLVIGWVPTWPSSNVLILTFPGPLSGTAHVS